MDGFKKCTSRPAPSVCRFLQQNRHKTDIVSDIADVRCWGKADLVLSPTDVAF